MLQFKSLSECLKYKVLNRYHNFHPPEPQIVAVQMQLRVLANYSNAIALLQFDQHSIDELVPSDWWSKMSKYFIYTEIKVYRASRCQQIADSTRWIGRNVSGCQSSTTIEKLRAYVQHMFDQIEMQPNTFG